MQAIVTALLSLVTTLLPLISVPANIQAVITQLEQIVPAIIKEAVDLVPMVQNIIAQLRGNGAVTPGQLAALDTLNAQCDAAFDAAAAQAGADMAGGAGAGT